MKKFLTVFLTLTMCVASLVAQTSITSVYGVQLGATESSVISSLNSQGKKGEWKSVSSGKCYQISSPKLGNCTFQKASFFFSNSGVFVKVGFYSSDGGTADPNFSGPNAYYPNQFNSIANSYQRIFKTMKMDLMGKYGSPLLEDDEQVVWKSSNGNTITLEYSYQDDVNGYGWHDCFTRVAVTYETSGGRPSNF